MLVEKTRSGKLVNHGLPSSYNNHKCRCDDCTKAWRVYMRPRIQAYRKRKKLEQAKGVQIRI